MRDFLKTVWSIVVIVLVFGAIIGVMIGLCGLIDWSVCDQKLDKMSIDGEWGLWSGCMVKTADFGVIPLDQYMFVLTAK